jgi:DNA-3-methyladenine glycosylase II
MRKAIIHLKKTDPVLRRIIEKVGPYRIGFREPTFDTLVRSIVYQQLSGKAANTIFNRLLEAAGSELTPKAVLKLKPAKLRAIGLSRQKSAYILDLARQHLTAVKGIGVWTAHMFLIFALRRTDVLPTGDLGVRVAIRKAYELAELPKPAEIEALAQAWRPYCSVAAWYLWRSLENQAAL